MKTKIIGSILAEYVDGIRISFSLHSFKFKQIVSMGCFAIEKESLEVYLFGLFWVKFYDSISWTGKRGQEPCLLACKLGGNLEGEPELENFDHNLIFIEDSCYSWLLQIKTGLPSTVG